MVIAIGHLYLFYFFLMKIIHPCLILVTLIVPAIAACKKNGNKNVSNNTNLPGTTGRSMTAKINGKYEVAANVFGSRVFLNPAVILYLSGTFDDGHQLTITVANFKEAGTYMLNNSAAVGTGTASWVGGGQTETVSNTAKEGILAVSISTQATLTGTFSLTTYDSTEITEGAVTVLF